MQQTNLTRDPVTVDQALPAKVADAAIPIGRLRKALNHRGNRNPIREGNAEPSRDSLRRLAAST
jgi:hypothetical protein